MHLALSTPVNNKYQMPDENSNVTGVCPKTPSSPDEIGSKNNF